MSDLEPAVYLDYAATSAVRPETVIRAVANFLRAPGATPGRGGHRLAVEAGRIALRCRLALARLLNFPGDPGRIAFMLNATHALNTALAGVLRAGDSVVVTQLDHNAVLRPVHHLATHAGIEVRLVPVDGTGTIDDAAMDRALDDARLLVINAASNVLGTATDVKRLAERARFAGALVLVDLAQAAGHLPFDAAAAGVDMVAITGHKALLGPQGIGALWVAPHVEIDPLLTGGTGGDSSSRGMPHALPDRLEAGTVNAPGIAGLLAGVEWVLDRGVDAMQAHGAALKQRLRDGLRDLPGVRIVSPDVPDGVPIVTVVADAIDPATLAARLDREHGVMTRAGLHCAPEAHRVLGTAATGAVRFSAGWASTEADIDRALLAMEAIIAGSRTRTVSGV